MRDEIEDMPTSLSSSSNEAAIHDRAMRFAATFDFINARIIESSAARDQFVSKYGTPGAMEYREVTIHMDWSPALREFVLSGMEDTAIAEELMQSEVVLLIVCSSTDVIHHEFPDWSLTGVRKKSGPT